MTAAGHIISDSEWEKIQKLIEAVAKLKTHASAIWRAPVVNEIRIAFEEYESGRK